MPCSDGRDFVETYRSEYLDAKARLDTTTRLLCALCRAVEGEWKEYKFIDIEAGELFTWWEKHKRADALRIERERQQAERQQLRDATLARLTPAEREALGM